MAACALYFSISLAALYALSGWFKKTVISRLYRDHTLIIGLTAESCALAKSMRTAGKPILLIDPDPEHALLNEMNKIGVIVLEGAVNQFSTLQLGQIMKANTLVIMTDNDLVNLSVLESIIDSQLNPTVTCYIAIENVFNHKLFEAGAFYAIDNVKLTSPGLALTLFNVNELAAIDVTKDLGANLDLTVADDSSKQSPLSVLICGFDAVGQSVLRELLLMGHFSTLLPTQIRVIADNNEQIQAFYSAHHQVLLHNKKAGLRLWDIEFIQAHEAELSPSSFYHIYSCYEEENRAVASILKFFELSINEQTLSTRNQPSFHYFTANNYNIRHPHIRAFGDVTSLVSYEQLILEAREQSAKRVHYAYTRSRLGLNNLSIDELDVQLDLHDKSEPNVNAWLKWGNQPLIKRRSNLVVMRSQVIKLKSLGGALPSTASLSKQDDHELDITLLPYVNELPDLNHQILANWLSSVLKERSLSLEQLIKQIDHLAIAEHNRWNAFHVVHNWRYGSTKNEQFKTHDCLLSWSDLQQKRPDTIKYDYNNIYHIAEQSLLN
jgi:Trk K+ transport system NAD-binding subunit